MYKKSNAVKLISLLLFFALVLTGCNKSSLFDKAAALYEKGEYLSADIEFEDAIREDPDNVDLRVGYGFNLAMLGKKAEAADVLDPIFESSILEEGSGDLDVRSLFDIGDALADIYLDIGKPSDAENIYDRLFFFAQSAEEKDKYKLKSAEIRAELYKDSSQQEQVYRTALTEIIDLSVYAGDEYVALVDSYRTSGDYEGMLAAADNMIIYMRGRSAHIDNYPSAISTILDAAEAAGFTEHDKTSDDYYDAAKEFITRAGDKGLTYEQKLRYRIVIAERMHQTDVAIRLLGVYLNHRPDDVKAVKEREFLLNRF
ncbi:MAG: hypothetical protein K6E95_06495 [Lachnospiraceae bacterium]|nr:hypothetical protein [Lachnospiraceae bacterium]